MKKPNLIFILIDDMGWRDLGCFGSSFYETPNLDRLFSRGMRFTDAYASAPVCSPTRASVMTGKYPATVGITDWIDHLGHSHPLRGRLVDVPYLKQLPSTETTLAEALRAGGYATWHVGKWHLGNFGHYPQDHGFEVNIGGCEAGSPGPDGYFSPWNIAALRETNVTDGTELTDYLTDQAISLIQKRDERPFFLNLWHYAVHTPIQGKLEKVLKYQKKASALGLDKIPAIEAGEFFPTIDKPGRRVRRRLFQSDPAYAAMVENLDDNIGRLLESLETCGEADNTLIVFTSDNGGLATAEGSPTCNKPLAEGKGWMYDGGIRVPLMALWPGKIPANSKCSVPVTSTDFFPTFLEAAGLDLLPKQHVDGVSLMPLLLGGAELPREALFWHYPHYGNQGGTPGSSIRSGDWKLIEFFEDGRTELYNLRIDLEEEHDVSEAHPEIVIELKEMLGNWRKRVEAKIPRAAAMEK